MRMAVWLVFIAVAVVDVVVYKMTSRYRRCHLGNIIFVLVISSLTTLAVSSQHKRSQQASLKAVKVRGEGQGHQGDNIDDAAAASTGWVNNRLINIKRSTDEDFGEYPPPSAPGSDTHTDTRKRGKPTKTSSETWRKKRSSRYPPHLRWLGRKSLSAAAAAGDDDDADSWLNALHPVSALQQSRLNRQSSPYFKRTTDWQRRGGSSPEEDGSDGDWDENGWADNNLRIWG